MHKLVATVLALTLPLIGQTATHKPASTAARPKPAASRPTAIIDTTAGKLTCTLFPDTAPIGAANFIGLAKGTKDWTNPASHRKVHGEPLYNGTIFHRVIPEFMIQGGDPAGSGSGDIGFSFKNETSPDLTFDRPGRLAYANAGPDTNGSQFFITEVATPFLNGKYTIFGQCDAPSVELVKKIARLPRNANDKPNNPPRISKITILASGGAAVRPATGAKSPTAPTSKRQSAPGKQQ